MATTESVGLLTRAWQWMIVPADETIADAARDGEILVARVRTWLTLMILVIPLLSLVLNPREPQNWIGLGVVSMAVIAAVILDGAVRRGLYRPGLSVITHWPMSRSFHSL